MEMQRAAAAANLSIADENNTFVKQAKALVEQLAAKGISPRELQRRGYPAAVVGSETENDYLLRHPSHAAQCRAAHFRGPEGKTSLAGEDEVSRERRWFRDVVRQKFDKNSRVVDPSFLYNAAVRRLLFEHFLRLGRPLPPDDSLARRLRSFAEDTSATLKGEADTRFTKLLDSIKRRLFVGSLAFDAYTGTGIPRLAKAGFGVARGMKTGQVAAAKAGEGLAAAAKTGAELAENAGERIVQGSGAARALLQEGLRYPLSHVRKMHAGYTWPLFAHDEFAYRVGETGAEGTHSTSFGEPVEDVPLGYFYLRRRHADFLENVTQRLKRSTDPEDTHIQEELRTKEQLEESERADADWWEKHEKEMAPENKAAAVADNATAQGTGDEGEEGEATGRGSASRAIQVEVESEEDGPAWTRWFFNMITQADYRAAVQETAKEVGFACADSTSRNGLIESALQSMSVDTAGEEVAGGFPKVCRPEVGQCEALTDPRACEESKVCESVFNSFRPVGVPEAVRLSEETHCRTYDFLFKSTKGKGFPEKEQVQTLLESNVGNRKSDADANINVAQEQEDEKDAASDEHERDKASTTNDIVSPDGKCEFKLFQCRTKRALSRREQWNRARTREFDSFGCGKYSQSKSDCAQHKPFCVYEMPRYCRKRSTAVNYVREKRGEGSVCRLAVPGSAGNVKVGCGAEAEFLARESGEIGAAGKGQQAPAASAAVKNCETASEGYVVRAPSEDPDYADRVVRELAVVPKSVEKVVEEKVLPHVREAFRDLIDAEVDSEETRVSAETRTLGKADEMPADNIEADVEAREKEATEAAGARGGGRSSVGEKAVLKPGEAQIRGLARYLRAQGPEAAAAAKRVTGIDRRMRAASRVQALLRFFSVDLEHEFARGTTNRIGPRPRMGITTRVGNYSEGHESHVDSQRWDQAYQSEMRGFKAMLDEATGSEFLDRLMGTLEAFRHIRPGSAAAATGNSLQPPSTLTPTGGTADGNSSQSTFDSMMYGLNLMRQNIAWFTVHKMGAPPVFTVGSEMAEKTVSTALHTAQTLVSKAMSSAACTFLDSDALLSQFHEMGHALLDDLSNFWMNMSGIAFVYSLQTAADEADGAGEEHTTWMRDSSTSDVVRDTRELPSFDNPFSSKRDFASVWNGARTDYCSEVPVSHCHEVEPCVVVRRRFRRRPKGYSERFRGYFGLSKESKGLQRDVREFQVCMSREFANTEVLEQDQVSQNLGDRFLGVSKTGGKQPDWSFDWNFQKPTNPTLIIPEVIKNRKLLGGSSLSKATSAEGGGLFRDTTSKYKSGKLLEE
ncbi:unnamed protein product [Amoebophrya sp. A25]|nr:unnamed protein product [Amoebophrya sp. A25]|eukprot:GSA25T00005865001.1